MTTRGNIEKEIAMRQDDNARTIGTRRAAGPSALHKLMGMSAEDVERELAAFGETPDQAAAAFKAVVAKARRPAARRLAMPPLATFIPALDRQQIGLARLFDEAVAAGVPSPSQSPEPGRPATLGDIFRGVPLDGKYFARVSGDSMEQAAIRDGDWALIDPHAECRLGDIVLAHIAPHGQVIKRLGGAEGALLLESANPAYEPIAVANPHELTIHGLVVWVCGMRRR